MEKLGWTALLVTGATIALLAALVLPVFFQDRATPVAQTPQEIARVLPDGLENRDGKTIRVKDGAEMERVRAGEFIMGSKEGDEDEKPARSVYLDEYHVDKFEVTVAQFKEFCGETRQMMPRQPSWNRDDHPVVGVSWEDATAYAKWAGASLPTEAQWEKAARGTDGGTYPWGNEAPDAGGKYRCNYDPGDNDADGYEYTAPVASFPTGASPYGCMDMAGNVWEWCADWYAEDYYAQSRPKNPSGPATGRYRVLRGGDWGNGGGYLRSANRTGLDPDYRGFYRGYGGFRCVVAARLGCGATETGRRQSERRDCDADKVALHNAGDSRGPRQCCRLWSRCTGRWGQTPTSP